MMRRLKGWPLLMAVTSACLMLAVACGDDTKSSGGDDDNNNPVNNNTNNPQNNNTVNNNTVNNNTVNNNTVNNNTVNNNTVNNNTVNNNTPDPIAACMEACTTLGTTCRDEFLEECPAQVVDGLIPACQEGCNDPDARAQITAVAGLPCATVVPLAVSGFGLTDLCADPDLCADADCEAGTTCDPADGVCKPDTSEGCDTVGFEAVQSTFAYDDFQGSYRFNALTAEEAPLDALAIAFYPSVDGERPAPLTAGPGTYPLAATAEDQSLATCTTCVLIYEGCTDEDGCATTYFATGGGIEVSAVDELNGVLVANLIDVELVEVLIDDETLETTPVEGGATWCLPSYAIDTTPECITDEDCTEEGKGICSEENVCVGCTSDLDCPAESPVCAALGEAPAACVAGVDECEGDDAFEQDDAAAAASALDLDAPRDAAICAGASGRELDWMRFTVEERKRFTFNLSWLNESADLDLYLLDEDVFVVDASEGATTLESISVVLEPGSYYLVVSPFDTQEVAAGGLAVPYTISVEQAFACAEDADCVEPGLPYCVESACVACSSSFDCEDPATPVCAADAETGVIACVAGPVGECAGDDDLEENDGPAAASLLVLDDSLSAALCEGASGLEADWFTFSLQETRLVELQLAWSEDDAAADLDLYVLDSDGVVFVSSAGATTSERVVRAFPAGDYYVYVLPYSTVDIGEGGTAVAYTLTTTTGEACSSNDDCAEPGAGVCDVVSGQCVACVSSFDCSAEAPFCDFSGDAPVCILVDVCTGDDTNEHSDDGPSGANTLVAGVPFEANICGDFFEGTDIEADWFTFTADAAGIYMISLSWADPEADLDLTLFDALGEQLDSSVFDQPELISATLEPGAYYVLVRSFFGAPTAAIPYTLSLTAP